MMVFLISYSDIHQYSYIIGGSNSNFNYVALYMDVENYYLSLSLLLYSYKFSRVQNFARIRADTPKCAKFCAIITRSSKEVRENKSVQKNWEEFETNNGGSPWTLVFMIT